MRGEATRTDAPGDQALAHGLSGQGVDWLVHAGLAPYAETVRAMEARAVAIADGAAREAIWLVEHPALYTAGTSARRADLIDPDRLPVFETGRGGQYTYHGPGQRVVYPMLDLKQRTGGDVRAYVRLLERVVIRVLAGFGVEGEGREDRVGVWVRRPDLGHGREDKIAAIGIRVRRGISLHGLSINVAPDLSHYGGIVPCGISEHGVTSLAALGIAADMALVDAGLRSTFEAELGAGSMAP
ncbi:MAG: lipoyl(octanoyl) transferase LipB [Hyphomicrobiaceae bacterium]|nr:lipoyl(octanoyl) transferase LipB [Hyphomicrobiaceae bacterium]